MRIQDVTGLRNLYRSREEMANSWEKSNKARAWFRTRRGGEKVSINKDYPTKIKGRDEEDKKSRKKRNKLGYEGVGDGEHQGDDESSIVIDDRYLHSL